MLSWENFLTSANSVINRLFPEHYFSQSWAYDYLQLVILYHYLLPTETQINFCDRREQKYNSGNSQFITILANVRNFWQESIRDKGLRLRFRLPVN